MSRLVLKKARPTGRNPSSNMALLPPAHRCPTCESDAMLNRAGLDLEMNPTDCRSAHKMGRSRREVTSSTDNLVASAVPARSNVSSLDFRHRRARVPPTHPHVRRARPCAARNPASRARRGASTPACGAARAGAPSRAPPRTRRCAPAAGSSSSGR